LTFYLHPEDHARLSGVFNLIVDDAKRALAARVGKLNTPPTVLGMKRLGKAAKEYKIASRDWVIDFFPDMVGTVPLGDVEIHSELNEGRPARISRYQDHAHGPRTFRYVDAAGRSPPYAKTRG